MRPILKTSTHRQALVVLIFCRSLSPTRFASMICLGAADDKIRPPGGGRALRSSTKDAVELADISAISAAISAERVGQNLINDLLRGVPRATEGWGSAPPHITRGG